MRQIDKMERGNFGEHREFDGIAELKLDFGSGYRVYYGKQGEVVILLIGGGDKKSQQADIVAAKARWEAWKKQGSAVADLPVWADGNQGTPEKEKDDSGAI